jgi:DNA-binding NtrC family response regulator
MQRGEFREDLYYRLGVFEIACRRCARGSTTSSRLADAFLAEIGETVGRPAARHRPRRARDQLLAYAWPGNVRELRNAIERAVILADGGLIPQRAPAGHVPRSASRPDDRSGSPTPAGG